MLPLRLIAEGNSVRGAPVTGLHRDTIIRLIVDAGEKCEALLSRVIRNVPVNEVNDGKWDLRYLLDEPTQRRDTTGSP